MNNSPVKSELYVALEMVELTQFLPFTKLTNFQKKKYYFKKETLKLFLINNRTKID